MIKQSCRLFLKNYAEIQILFILSSPVLNSDLDGVSDKFRDNLELSVSSFFHNYILDHIVPQATALPDRLSVFVPRETLSGSATCTPAEAR